MLPAALLATALWQTSAPSAYPEWARWLTPLAFGGSVLAALPLVVTRLCSPRVWRRWAPGLVGAGLVALLLAPLSWALTPVLAAPSNASLPEARPTTLSRSDPTSWTQLGAAGSTDLITYLQAHSAGYFYLVVVTTAQQASPLALAAGKPVLAAGGFMGSDPALTAGKLAALVATKRVRFVMGLGGGAPGGGSSAAGVWIGANCQVVDPSAYGGQSGLSGPGGFPGFGGFQGGNSSLYDCAASS